MNCVCPLYGKSVNFTKLQFFVQLVSQQNARQFVLKVALVEQHLDTRGAGGGDSHIKMTGGIIMTDRA